MHWDTATLAQVQAFTLILARVSAVFLAAPVLGNERVPVTVKASLALLCSLLLLMSMDARGISLPPAIKENVFALTGAILGELLIGFLIAYTAFLFFSGIQMAGMVVDIQVGFGLVNVLDPSGNNQVSIMGQFYYVVAMLYFLLLDGHHILLRALGDSFQLIPPGQLSGFTHMAVTGPYLTGFFTRLFIIAIQVAGPSLVTLFLTNISMGLLSRTIPQMNVFIVGLPLNILVGIGITVLSLRLLAGVLHSVVYSMGEGIAQLLHGLVA
jgi:flagellar biosynthetic protein FliR